MKKFIYQSTWFISLVLLVVVASLLVSSITGIALDEIPVILILIGMLMTILVITIDLDKDTEKHIIERYRFKGLWYGIVAINTIFPVVISESGILNFDIILLSIALVECFDNFKSYSIRNQKKN